MPPRKKTRVTQTTLKESCPDVQLSRLRRLLDDQFRKEGLLETTEDDEMSASLERGIIKGTVSITKAINDYLQAPFLSKSSNMKINDEQRAALRELRKALARELNASSNSAKRQLWKANESLVQAFNTKEEIGNDGLQWEPKRFRILDRSDPAFDSDYSSSSEDEQKVNTGVVNGR